MVKNPTARRTRARAEPAGKAKPEGQGRTQLERRAEAEAKLLAAARGMVAHKGWAGTTLADIGEAAGYSRGLAGHYFGNKAGVLRALTDDINNNMMEHIRAAPPAAEGLDSVVAYVSVYFSRRDPMWTNTRTILGLLTEALLENSGNAEQMLNFNASTFRYLEHNIRVGIRKGEVHKSVSPAIGAEFVIGTLRGMMLQRLVRGGEIQAAAMKRQVMALVRRAFSPAASAT